MPEVTKYVKYISYFEKELVWTVIPQLESLLSIACCDIIKNLDHVYVSL